MWTDMLRAAAFTAEVLAGFIATLQRVPGNRYSQIVLTSGRTCTSTIFGHFTRQKYCIGGESRPFPDAYRTVPVFSFLLHPDKQAPHSPLSSRQSSLPSPWSSGTKDFARSAKGNLYSCASAVG